MTDKKIDMILNIIGNIIAESDLTCSNSWKSREPCLYFASPSIQQESSWNSTDFGCDQCAMTKLRKSLESIHKVE